ncbi:unnamed protein product [Nezara viridula]|uniref:Uncharacterized protein n=1 Tax=Nezara viridula TaxID=85310 RepID=A0A9P0MWV4_NEZVI|nr:unnamed protein product [Nezara viridula]
MIRRGYLAETRGSKRRPRAAHEIFRQLIQGAINIGSTGDIVIHQLNLGCDKIEADKGRPNARCLIDLGSAGGHDEHKSVLPVTC